MGGNQKLLTDASDVRFAPIPVIAVLCVGALKRAISHPLPPDL
jgi:hypothetical protein